MDVSSSFMRPIVFLWAKNPSTYWVGRRLGSGSSADAVSQRSLPSWYSNPACLVVLALYWEKYTWPDVYVLIYVNICLYLNAQEEGACSSLRLCFIPVEFREWKGEVTVQTRRSGNVVNSVHPILDAFAKLRQATVSFVMSVRPPVRMEHLGSTGRTFTMKFDIWVVFGNLLRTFRSDKNNRYFTWRPACIYISLNSPKDTCCRLKL